MADMNEFNNMGGDVVSGVEPIKKKKKGPVIAGITAGVIGVAAGGGIIAYNMSDFVKNQVKLRLSKPEKYYAWVCDKNSSNLASEMSEAYRKSLDKLENGASSSVSVTYELSDSVKSLLDDTVEDMGSNELTDLVKGINSVSIGTSADVKGSKMSGSYFVNLNDDKLVSMDMAMDMGSYDTFLRIPELTEKWLGVDGSLITTQIDSEEMDQFTELYGKAFEDPESVISPDELEKVINRYTNVWTDSVKDVELEKKAEIEVGDYTVKYTVATVEIDQKKGKEIITNFGDAVKDDDTIKAIVVDRLGLMKSGAYDDAIDELVKSIEDIDVDEDDDTTVTVDTYIDPNGDIRGFGMDADDVKVYFIIGKDGDNICGEGYVKQDGEELFRIDITSKADGKKSNGSIDITAEDETVSVEFTGYEVVDEEKGYFNGDFTVKLPKSADMGDIKLNCESDGSSQKMSGDIEIDGTNYGKVIVEIAADMNGSPKIPDKSDAFMANEDSKLEDYVSKKDIENFIAGIFGKIGLTGSDWDQIPEFLADNVMSSIDGSGDFGGFGGDDYGWDDEDWDDEDFDFDDDDYDWNFEDEDDDDEYANTKVAADLGQGYMFIMDSGDAYYMGTKSDSLSYEAVNADVKGDGTYTVKVSADTKGYKAKYAPAKGITYLALQIYGVSGLNDAEITIKSVKVDGKDYKVADKIDYDSYSSSATLDLYTTWSGADNAVDLSDVDEWKTVEIEFEVKGL